MHIGTHFFFSWTEPALKGRDCCLAAGVVFDRTSLLVADRQCRAPKGVIDEVVADVESPALP